MLAAIFASDLAGGFGFQQGLPWPHIKEDMRHFRLVTNMYKNMVMGSNTAKSLPKLEGRLRWVVSSDDSLAPELFDFKIDSNNLRHLPCGNAIIIGGPGLLTPEYLDLCDVVYHTTVKAVYPSDVRIDKDTLAWLGERQSEARIVTDTSSCIIREYRNAKF